jgi:hypothetical protein
LWFLPPSLVRPATGRPRRGDHPAKGLSLGRFRSYLRRAEARETVPEAQREAVVLHLWQDWSLADSDHHLGHGLAAVAGLLQLGLQQLRSLLREPQES